MKFSRETYDLGAGHTAISYEIGDDNGHTIQLTASEALDLLECLNGRRSQIMRDMHAENLGPLPPPPSLHLPSWLDDLGLDL